MSKHSLTVTLHFTEVSHTHIFCITEPHPLQVTPAPDVKVIVISIVSMSSLHISNVLFQAAVPKVSSITVYNYFLSCHGSNI